MKRQRDEFGGGRPHSAAPYSADGIRRVLCSRRGCGRRAYATWGACADDNWQRPLCAECDVELNELALRWIGDPQVDEKIAAYSQRVREAIGGPLDTDFRQGGFLPPGLTVVVNDTGEPERVLRAARG